MNRALSRAAVAFTVAALILGSSAFAQPPGMTTCSGFNHLTTTSSGSQSIGATTRLAVQLVLTSPALVDGVQWYFLLAPISPSLSVGGGTVAILPADPGTGLPGATPVASMNWPATAGGSNWSGPTFASTATLNPGIWWITYTRAPLLSTQLVAYQDNPPGPDLTTWALESGGAWTLQTTPRHFKLRTFAVTCAPPPLAPAAIAIVGSGCQGTAGIPVLSNWGLQLPQLGNTSFALQVQNGAPTSFSYWFIAATAQANAAVLGGGCAVHLELTSLLTLVTLGVNPVLTLPTDGAGYVFVPLPIPSDPLLAGQTTAVQVAIIDPASPIGVTLTGALVATVGI